jgi:hypothetical protein
MTGMLGVHLAAVELVKRGFIVSPTSRSAMGADLLVTDQRCQKAWSVQVKTNTGTPNFWLVNPNTKNVRSHSHVYVFINVPKNPERQALFYVVPSRIVADTFTTTPPRGTKGSIWHSFKRVDKYQNNWKIFGDPQGVIPQRARRTA